MKSNCYQINERDIMLISVQIGRQPRAVRSIAHRCPHNFPVVIVSEPLIYQETVESPEFFPTTYWLSCPQLKKRISELESTGIIDRLEKIFLHNVELREMLQEAHASYIHERFGLIGREEFLNLKNTQFPGLKKILRVGIGGIEDFKYLKCLHAHIAHHLAANNNPVGQMALELIANPFCPDGNSYCQRQTDPECLVLNL